MEFESSETTTNDALTRGRDQQVLLQVSPRIAIKVTFWPLLGKELRAGPGSQLEPAPAWFPGFLEDQVLSSTAMGSRTQRALQASRARLVCGQSQQVPT